MPTPKYVNQAYTLLKKFGYTYDMVERTKGRYSSDFCGFADIIAFHPIRGNDLIKRPGIIHSEEVFRGALAVQVCRYVDFAEHIAKVSNGLPHRNLFNWLLSYNRFEVWAFPAPYDKRVKGKRYHPKFVSFHLPHDQYLRDRWTPEHISTVYNDSELQAFGYELEHNIVQK